MDFKKIASSLQDIFNEPLKDGEQRKIVFWTDMDEDFIDGYEQIDLDGVNIVHLHKNNQFYIKHLLEEEDTESSYLIYTNLDLDSDENWLYDTVQYSKTFYADRISLLLNEFNIGPSLRQYVQQYIAFFGAQDRRKRLKDFDIHFETREALELAMMNALCRNHSLDFQTVLRTVLMDTLDDESNRYLHDFNRFFDIDTFWSYVEREYAYNRENKTLQTLFMHLAITAFSRNIPEKYLATVQHFVAESNRTNIYVFIDQWMHHRDDYQIYNEYIKQTEEEINLQDMINSMPIDAYKDANVFPYIDRAVIIYIANNLIEQYEDYDMYLSLINERRNKHFYEQYKHLYEALYYTVKIFQFQKEYAHGIPLGQAIDMYEAYTDEYYLMDTYYRKFYVAFDAANSNEVLLKLQHLVENLYTNWYKGELSAHWSQAVEEEMTEQWSLPGIYNQQQFYSHIISHHEERVFVIISDALRYEIGVELQEALEQQTFIKGTVELQNMLGIVPSVTKLGMAALLPHRKLEIDNNQVTINGMSTSGIDNRQKILHSYVDESLAINYESVLQMTSSERAETFRGKKLIYIYHDSIDAIGDNTATEINTFNAAEEAVDQILELSRIIINGLSGTRVYVTADHGFIYQREKLEVADLMSKEDINALEVKRRYMLSETKKEVSGQHCINLSSVIDNEDPLYVYVPKATMRYRIQGAGANFVHGGASLQEVVVPLLYIRNKRTGQRGAEAVQKVDISLTSTTRRITNSIFTLDFFQTEQVADRKTPRTVVIYMADELNNVLSTEETIIGDLENDDPKERIFKVQFTLQNKKYDRNQTYYLIMKDEETDAILERIPFTINLGIISDFDF